LRHYHAIGRKITNCLLKISKCNPGEFELACRKPGFNFPRLLAKLTYLLEKLDRYCPDAPRQEIVFYKAASSLAAELYNGPSETRRIICRALATLSPCQGNVPLTLNIPELWRLRKTPEMLSLEQLKQFRGILQEFGLAENFPEAERSLSGLVQTLLGLTRGSEGSPFATAIILRNQRGLRSSLKNICESHETAATKEIFTLKGTQVFTYLLGSLPATTWIVLGNAMRGTTEPQVMSRYARKTQLKKLLSASKNSKWRIGLSTTNSEVIFIDAINAGSAVLVDPRLAETNEEKVKLVVTPDHHRVQLTEINLPRFNGVKLVGLHCTDFPGNAIVFNVPSSATLSSLGKTVGRIGGISQIDRSILPKIILDKLS
jgi:hypothetical protein